MAVEFVGVTERKSVVDWLEGKITDHERIVPLVGESSCACGTIAKLTVYLQQNQLPPRNPSPPSRYNTSLPAFLSSCTTLNDQDLDGAALVQQAITDATLSEWVGITGV